MTLEGLRSAVEGSAIQWIGRSPQVRQFTIGKVVPLNLLRDSLGDGANMLPSSTGTILIGAPLEDAWVFVFGEIVVHTDGDQSIRNAVVQGYASPDHFEQTIGKF